MTFELDKIYTLVDEPGTITRNGKRLIARFISQQRLSSDDWKGLNPQPKVELLPALPDSWAWKWLIDKGEYRGTFPKRVSSFYYKTLAVKTPDTFNAEIGNLARTHSQTADLYRFDFTATFDWMAGEFGDEGSCFWGSNAGAKDMLTENGGLAMRFYDGGTYGYARAWMFPVDDLYYVFNGYGLQTSEITQVFARFMGLDYAKVSLTNNASAYGTLHINGGYGYVVGQTEVIAPIKRYDFGLTDIDRGEECHNCGEYIADAYHDDRGYAYCESCFYGIYDYCERCGRLCDREDIRHTADDEYLCDRCLSDYNECDGCWELHHTDNLNGFKGRLFCPNCLHD